MNPGGIIKQGSFVSSPPFDDAQNLDVVERLTRVDGDSILYQFTACHVANYGLLNILRGARVTEAEAAKKAAK